MLATSRMRRSASLLDAAEQRLALALGHVLAQRRGGRGDRGERRAQVVRDRLQQRGAQAVGLLERLQQHALVLQPRAPEREAEDAAERLEHRAASRRSRRRWPVSTPSNPYVTPLSEIGQRDDAAVAAQRDDRRAVRRVHRLLEPRAGRRGPPPACSSSSSSRTVTRSAAPRRPSASLRSESVRRSAGRRSSLRMRSTASACSSSMLRARRVAAALALRNPLT